MWITMVWQHISPEVIVRDLGSAVYPVQWIGLMIFCGMTVMRMGMLGR